MILHAFPPRDPQAFVLIDVVTRDIEFLRDAEAVRQRFASYDVIVGLDLRPLLRALDFDPGARRLADLATHQKTRSVNEWGRSLKVTTKLLIQGSCGISRPLADAASLRRHLQAKSPTRLRRRLEADAKSLFALYQYTRLHRCARLRWGFLDEMLPAPWVESDEPSLYGFLQNALARDQEVEVVAGSAPGWADPWSRARRCRIVEQPGRYRFGLVDLDGVPIDTWDVHLVRLA